MESDKKRRSYVAYHSRPGADEDPNTMGHTRAHAEMPARPTWMDAAGDAHAWDTWDAHAWDTRDAPDTDVGEFGIDRGVAKPPVLLLDGFPLAT